MNAIKRNFIIFFVSKKSHRTNKRRNIIRFFTNFLIMIPSMLVLKIGFENKERYILTIKFLVLYKN